MAKARLDQTGKVYIPRGIRKAVGIKEGDLFDVEVQGSSVVLSRSRLRIARQGKGQFRLKRRIKDVDKGIERLSTIVGAGELGEIRRR